MNTKKKHSNSIFYPPGGILMWIIIFIELITFCMALLAALYDASYHPKVYYQSSLHLNLTLGTINTFVLLISGYFMAQGLHFFKKHHFSAATKQLNIGLLLGGIFMVIKTIEYYHKIQLGDTIGKNSFFLFYWLLTGFHFIHILVGVIIILFIKKNLSLNKLEDLEAGIAFWHMCDLIWLLLFPILYLYFRMV